MTTRNYVRRKLKTKIIEALANRIQPHKDKGSPKAITMKIFYKI